MPRRPSLNQEQVEHIRHLHKAGVLVKEIAAQLPISPRTIQDAVGGKGAYRNAKACRTCACCRYWMKKA